jgi:hypothetical protein
MYLATRLMRLPGIRALPRPSKERDCIHPADRFRRQITGQDSCRRPAKIIVVDHETHGEALFRAIVDGDHEGIVAKRADAPYGAGPSRA